MLFTRRIGEPLRHEACGDGSEQLVADGRRVDLVRVRARVRVSVSVRVTVRVRARVRVSALGGACGG